MLFQSLQFSSKYLFTHFSVWILNHDVRRCVWGQEVFPVWWNSFSAALIWSLIPFLLPLSVARGLFFLFFSSLKASRFFFFYCDSQAFCSWREVGGRRRGARGEEGGGMNAGWKSVKVCCLCSLRIACGQNRHVEHLLNVLSRCRPSLCTRALCVLAVWRW